MSGEGTVYSYTIPSRPSPGELPARGFDYPYAVVLIELPDADGVRIASNLSDCDLRDIRIGMKVEVHFGDLNEDIAIPVFKPLLADHPAVSQR